MKGLPARHVDGKNQIALPIGFAKCRAARPHCFQHFCRNRSDPPFENQKSGTVNCSMLLRSIG